MTIDEVARVPPSRRPTRVGEWERMARLRSAAEIEGEPPAVSMVLPLTGLAPSETSAPVPDDRATRHRLGRGVSLVFLIQAAGVALKFLSQLVLARLLGAAALGQYVYSLNLARVLASPADLGGQNAVLRFVPEHRARREPQLVAGVFRAARLVTLLLGAQLAVVAGAVALLGGGGPVPLAVLVPCLVCIPLLAFSDVQSSLSRTNKQLVSAYLPTLVAQPVALTAGAAVLWATDRLDAASLSLVSAAILVAVAAVQARLFAGRRRPEESAARSYDLRRWLSVSLPLLSILVVQLVFKNVDVLLVGLFLGARDAGVYAVAFRVAGLASLLQFATNSAIGPRIAELHWQGRRQELQRTLLEVLRRIAYPSLAITLVLVVLGRPILGIFGPEFRAGWATLAVYALGQLASVSAGPVGMLLGLTGSHRKSAVVSFGSSACCLVAYLVLIPLFGIVGAAAANAIGVVIKNVWSNLVARKLGYRISMWRAMRPRQTWAAA